MDVLFVYIRPRTSAHRVSRGQGTIMLGRLIAGLGKQLLTGTKNTLIKIENIEERFKECLADLRNPTRRSGEMGVGNASQLSY
jgi:hypothetical protein